jgi:GINS complex subunit 4
MDSQVTDDGQDKNSTIQLEEMHHLGELRVSWCNEKRSPELLPFAAEAVDQVSILVRSQHDVVADADSPRHKDMRDIVQLDADRAEFIIKAYLRIRLVKIQKYASYYIEKESHKLSPSERTFAIKLVSIQAAHFKSSFLHCLPPNDDFQSISNPNDISGNMLASPDLSCFVFINVLNDNEPHLSSHNIVCGTKTNTYTLTLNKGSSYLVKYADVRGLLEQSKIILV